MPGRQKVSRSVEGADLYSKLYCRLNGFMLGVFMAMCEFNLARKRYPFYRSRIEIFLQEIGARIAIPSAFGQRDEWIALVAPIGSALAKRSPVLTDFYLLGSFAIAYTLQVKRNRAEAEQYRRIAHRILLRHGLPFAEFDALVKPESKPARSVHDLMSPALLMLTTFLRPLRAEPKTCFVAMPFRKPFEGYYPDYYQPLLRRAGYRPLRAWGGFGDEDFSPLLVAMILKSGAFLADISKSKANVLWELGVAQGAGKTVFLVQDERNAPPADLAKHLTLRYNPREKNWASRAIDEQIVTVALLSFASEKLGADPIRIASGLRLEDAQATATSLKDAFSEISFSAARRKRKSDAAAHIQRGLERIESQRWREAERDFSYAIRRVASWEWPTTAGASLGCSCIGTATPSGTFRRRFAPGRMMR
jgi:hypothetical protein